MPDYPITTERLRAAEAELERLRAEMRRAGTYRADAVSQQADITAEVRELRALLGRAAQPWERWMLVVLSVVMILQSLAAVTAIYLRLV